MGAAVLPHGLGRKSGDAAAVVVTRKLLECDDLGIAFGKGTAHETGHAPLGAVDWVAVFPPSIASRIFSVF